MSICAAGATTAIVLLAFNGFESSKSRIIYRVVAIPLLAFFCFNVPKSFQANTLRKQFSRQ